MPRPCCRSRTMPSMPKAGAIMADYIERRRQQPHFANARSIRNALDRARLRHANRLFEASNGPTDAAALSTITAGRYQGQPRVFRSTRRGAIAMNHKTTHRTVGPLGRLFTARRRGRGYHQRWSRLGAPRCHGRSLRAQHNLRAADHKIDPQQDAARYSIVT